MRAQAIPDVVVSHWSTLIEDFQGSSLAFYGAFEVALRRRDIPNTEKSRVDYRESGLLSARREYLRVRREKLVFDVCAAPFGTGFFVSYWLAEDRPQLNPLLKAMALFGLLFAALWLVWSMGLFSGLITIMIVLPLGLWGVQEAAAAGTLDDDVVIMLPLIGRLYLWLFKPATYYRLDTMLMFQQAVHNSVLEVIDVWTTEKGIRALRDTERKPVMRGFYGSSAA